MVAENFSVHRNIIPRLEVSIFVADVEGSFFDCGI
jgi:hypothetical protein